VYVDSRIAAASSQGAAVSNEGRVTHPPLENDIFAAMSSQEKYIRSGAEAWHSGVVGRTMELDEP
jgi:hypothetical protein